MDTSRYIGIPFRDGGRDFSGLDCWGLVRLVWREEKGVVMPDMGDEYSSAFERGDVGPLFDKYTSQNWNISVAGMKRRPLDVLVFRFGRLELHAGLWVAPNEMLHVMQGMETCIERYDQAKWAKRLSRILRPVEERCGRR
jgi:cell wall-associated NlpC family hydrolase